MTFDAIGRDLLPGERAAAREFVERYSKPHDREAVRQEQQRVMDEVRNAFLADQSPEKNAGGAGPTDSSTSVPLLPLSAFHQAQPDLVWTATQPAHVVPLREGERFVVQLEESEALFGYGPWRNDELANQGVACCEEDAKSFAQGLLDAINDRLSLHELEYVVAAFSAEVARREAERQAAIAAPSKHYDSSNSGAR